jgi:hypothetical protein
MEAGEREHTERMQRLRLEKEDYYFSPEGYLVFTEAYHLKRGYCCQSGCRHCPYEEAGEVKAGRKDGKK